MKEVKSVKKKMMFIITSLVMTLTYSAMAFAAANQDIVDAITTGVGDVKTTAIDVIGAVAPVAIAIMGAGIAVKVGLRWFRSLVSG